MRDTEALKIEGEVIEVYRTPLYGDQVYLEDERVKLGFEIVDNRPRLVNPQLQNVGLLRLSRAIATINGVASTRDDILSLSLATVRQLNIWLDASDWKTLGEAAGPQVEIGS